MNTPLTNLINWLKENQSSTTQECIEMAESLLEEEKIELIKAREDGIYTMINGTIQDKQLTSEDYFNRVYKQNQ